MKRVAFKMRLKPGYVDEYIRRHDKIWLELVEHLKNAGLGKYSIFLDSDGCTLFAVQNQGDDFSSTKLSQHPIMKKWWTYMSDIMEVNEDLSPKVEELHEVFYLD